MLLAYILPWLTSRNLSISIAILSCGLLAVVLAVPAYLPAKVNNFISKILHLYLCWRYPIKDPSGRHSLPTSPYIWPNGQGDTGKFLEGIENSVSWEKSHGRIYRIWSGMRSEVVLTSPEHLQAVFHDSDKHTKAANNNSGHIMSQLLGQCVGLISGRSWQTLRAVTEVPFIHRNASSYISTIEEHVERHLDGLERHGNLGSGLIHPAEDLKHLPFWIVAEVFYGKLSPALTAQLEHIMPLREELFKFVIRGGLSRFSWMRFFPTEAGRALATFKHLWARFNEAAYEHAVASCADAPIVPMTAAVRAGTISTEELYQTLDEALFANLDVTTGGLSWPLVFLAANPAAQAKLRDEILAATAATAATATAAATATVAATAPQDMRRYVASSTTYLAASITESSRLKPLAAFSVAQSAPTAREVGGYVIPAGTDFIADSYALNQRNPFWGPDSADYRPDRFLERAMSGTKLRYQFWRFGFGPRQCMGKYVADLIIRVLLVRLISGWRLGLVRDGDEWKKSEESWITHPDFLVRCERRTRRGVGMATEEEVEV